MKGGYSQALANLRRHHIAVYGTFVFGYDHDTPDSFGEAVAYAREQSMYIAAFNHMTPFRERRFMRGWRRKTVCALSTGGSMIITVTTNCRSVRHSCLRRQ